MGKSKRNRNKAPHANGVNEVMQQVKARTAAAKPPLSEEEQLTLTEAQEVLERKEEILAEAVREKERIESELPRIRKELEEVEFVLAAKKETLRLNEEAQAIIDQEASVLARAEAQAQKRINTAAAQAEQGLKAAGEQMEVLKADAEREAQRLLEERRTQAEQEAQEILAAARQEERTVVEGKERVAQMSAAAIIARAEDYAQHVHENADAYEQQIRESAQKKADEIAASAGEILRERERGQDQRDQELQQREIALTRREAALPEQAEQLAQERLEAMRSALEYQQARQAEKQALLDDREEELTFQAQVLEEAKRLFEDRVERTVQERYAALCNALEQKRQTANDLNRQNKDLLAKVDNLTMWANKLKQGKDIQVLQQRLENIEAQRARLEEELRVFQENGITRDRLAEILSLRDQVTQLQTYLDSQGKELAAAKQQAAMNVGAARQLEEEKSLTASQKVTIGELMEELSKRKQVSRVDMLRPIQEPPVLLSEPKADWDPEDLAREDDWLAHIQKQAGRSGIIFSERQLMAYHTCLKIGEWAPLVVLSGVSGTGKSELPKQYAIHGGMQFLSLPVKPDWDSPASLFGYYNSIENKFEATELVRTLYQMQSGQKTPWSSGMLMVLLDEMNLAHPEQYFADLLSKFEEARNSERVPCYEIALGAGERPELLEIGRNVLWTGTMNEDETTKGLSDKVIDRSMLITFPCPKKLYDRGNNKIEAPQLTLSFNRWTAWKREALSGDAEIVKEKLERRKRAIEEINTHMSNMGRNLGHRVWQSIQNYILNYPKVIAAAQGRGDMALEDAMQQAFCDALAFKMMPKLRGLEVRGQNENHINQLRDCLVGEADALTSDFEKACKMTSEVFQWNSADFMGL